MRGDHLPRAAYCESWWPSRGPSDWSRFFHTNSTSLPAVAASIHARSGWHIRGVRPRCVMPMIPARSNTIVHGPSANRIGGTFAKHSDYFRLFVEAVPLAALGVELEPGGNQFLACFLRRLRDEGVGIGGGTADDCLCSRQVELLCCSVGYQEEASCLALKTNACGACKGRCCQGLDGQRFCFARSPRRGKSLHGHRRLGLDGIGAIGPSLNRG